MSAGLSCGGSIMKCALFVFNFVFWLAGAAMLGVGIWLVVDDNVNQYLEVINYNQDDYLVEAATYTLIGVGSFIFLVGFLGCCGAIQNNSCMLMSYAWLCVICLAGELTVAILAVIYKDEISLGLEEEMAKQASQYVTNDTTNADPITAAWNVMQYDFQCCGSTNFLDYEDNPSFGNDNPVPLTCCTLTNDDPQNPEPENLDQCYEEARYGFDTGFVNRTQYLHGLGCHEALYTWLDDRLWILIGAGFGVAFIQMLGIVFACCVRKELQGDVDF